MDRLTIAEWLDFDARHPAPTFFARPAWALALCDVTPALQPHPMRITLEGRTFLVPALRSSSRTGLKHIQAFPLGGYTCVLDADAKPADALSASAAIAAVGASADVVTLVYWPLAPQPVARKAGRMEHEAAVVDCANGFESVVAGVRGVTRRMAGQAARRGVTCAPCKKTRADIDDYYELLREASVGWGLSEPPYSRALIDALMERGGDDVEVWFAQADGERIAGGIIFYGAEELFFWSAAMRRTHSQLRPSNALNLALMERACERGLRWYNLGASAGLAGVERFKTDLGANAVTYPEFTFKRTSYVIYERVRARFASLHGG